MSFFTLEFESADADEIEMRIASRAGHVSLHGRPNYSENLVGDEHFLLGRHRTSAEVGVTLAATQVFVLQSDASSPWQSGAGEGDLVEGPAYFPPEREIAITHAAQSTATSVTLERHGYERLARAYFGDAAPLRVDAALPMSPIAASFWDGLTDFAAAVPLEYPLVRANAYRALAFGLLDLFDVMSDREAREAAVGRREMRFRRATEFLDAHADLPIGIEAAAAAADVSVRDLRRLFVAFTSDGSTPERYLRQRRLDGAHLELLRCAPAETSVRIIAWRWGFARPGTFVRLHLERFGEMPHEVLERRRARGE